MNPGRIIVDAGFDTELLRAFLHPIGYEQVRLMPAPLLLRLMWAPGVHAMTVMRWVFVHPDALAGDRMRLGRLLVHELVHVRQWSDYGFFGFLSRYLTDYMRARRQGLDHEAAYRWNRLEVEARTVTEAVT